ncbi:MAG TPA: ABC transporter permease [Candidatus Stackebrandtia excrementipullorum]|nr:ABC transporter permease [Candidatus Stackebrandtia excrementipullorum]
MIAAVRVEALKLVRSLVGMIAALALVLGTVALLSGITFGVAGGNPELIAQVGPAAELNWDGLLTGAAQITAIACILGFGIVLAWMFGREFTDGTITGLFALPVGRSRIALAKLIVYTVWAFVVGTAMALGVLLLGVLFGYGAPSTHAWAGLGRLWALAMFSAGVAIPIAWIATWTRSLLGGVAGTVALVVITQIGALTGVGAWMPPAAPAIWAMSHGTRATALHLALTGSVAVVFGALTCWTWKRLQLDR